MSAVGNLSKPQFPKHLYHESHLSNRESIRQGGLEARTPVDSWGDGSKTPKGVYMSAGTGSEYGSSMHDSAHFGYDKWRVNVEGRDDLQRDPDTGHSTSVFTPNAIEPSRMKLVKKGSPDWERNI